MQVNMISRYAAATAIFILALVTRVRAVPVLESPEQWEIDESGWVKQDQVGANVDVSQEILSGNGYLNVNINASAFPASVNVVANSSASGGRFYGDYTPVQLVQFRFYAEDTLPNNIALYFYAASGRTWQYNLSDPLNTGVWTTCKVPFGSRYVVEGTGWHGPPPGYISDDFLADTVNFNMGDWIGIHIDRALTAAAEDYGLDDFELTIPEP